MEKIKLSGLIDTINESPTGGFIGVSQYKSEKGDVTSVVGQLGCSYAKAKESAIQALSEAIKANDFEDVTVTGKCHYDDGVWNARKKSAPLKDYKITYKANTVQNVAEEILEAWQNPKERINFKY
jgi:hypothetical protein